MTEQGFEDTRAAPAEGLSFWQRAAFTLKLLLVGVLVVLFVIPMQIVHEIVDDRKDYRGKAEEDVAAAWAKPQNITGPVLVVPYTYVAQYTEFSKELNKNVTHTQREEGWAYALSETLSVTSDIQTEMRSLGLYAVPVYTADIKMTAAFADPASVVPEYRDIEIGDPYLAIGITDPRGLGQDFAFTWGGAAVEPKAGLNLNNLGSGIHIPLARDAVFGDGAQRTFSGHIPLKGVGHLRVTPAAKTVEMTATSPWPSPNFLGLFLPVEKSVSADGFTARWATNILATDVMSKLESCIKNDQACYDLEDLTFSVRFFNSVDIYHQAVRAAKYGMLFVVLVFGVFFVSEAVWAMRIHPAQYTLVGGALCLFYLIVLSLSEHVPFGMAYALATAATAGLLAYYVSHVLKSTRAGLCFGLVVAALYGALYFILQAEDYALLTGTGLLFCVLAAAMVATRKLDWYGIGSAKQ